MYWGYSKHFAYIISFKPFDNPIYSYHYYHSILKMQRLRYNVTQVGSSRVRI